MTTRISSDGPSTYVAAVPTAARTTAPPARPFQQVMAAGASAVVRSAEQAAARLPGGPLLATALRPSTAVVPGASQQSPEGLSSALSASGTGLGSLGAPSAGIGSGAPSMDGVLSQSVDQNMYFLELQERISQESRSYSALSNVLKARHETLKNAIGNIR